MAKKRSVPWHWVELTAVGIPLLLILAVQYVSLSRSSELRLLAHESVKREYIDSLSREIQAGYRRLADDVLAVPAEAVEARRFDVIQEHFARKLHPAIKQLFVGVLEDCSCKTQYLDPRRGTLSVESDASISAAVLRVSVPWRLQQGRLLTVSELLTDRQDSNTRILYRVVANKADRVIGVIGLVIDLPYLVNVRLPDLVRSHLQALPDGIQSNLIVSTRDGRGDVVYSSAPGDAQGDNMSGALAFVFDDFRVDVRSRRIAAQELASSLRTEMSVSMLMCAVILIGVGLAVRGQRQAARASRLKTEFVANVTHELRTPLASICLMGELLRRGRVVSPERIVEYGSRIEIESYRLQRSVSNILDIARIESNLRQYSTEEVSIEDVVERVLASLELVVAQKGIVLHYEGPNRPVPPITADARALGAVILNLIDNAVKYSGTSRDVHISMDCDDDRVAVHVADHGIGIPKTHLTSIFDAFYRVSDGAAAGLPGTGLGLAIVQHTIAAHGGNVEVRSTPGHGTTFTVRLPLVRTPQRQTARAGEAKPHEVEAAADLQEWSLP